MMGICGGPGGRGTVVLLVVEMDERVALMRKRMQRVTRAMNHVSIT